MSSVGKMYVVCSLFHNAITCLYGKQHLRVFFGKTLLPYRTTSDKSNAMNVSISVKVDIHIQRCIQSASLRPGTHSFFTQRILNEGSNWTQKKNRMFMQITNSRSLHSLFLHSLFRCKFQESSQSISSQSISL